MTREGKNEIAGECEGGVEMVVSRRGEERRSNIGKGR